MVLSRSILAALRRNQSKINLIRSPVQESISINSFYGCSKPRFTKSRISEFSPPIISNPVIQNGLKSIRTPIHESISTTSFSPNCESRSSEFSPPVYRNSFPNEAERFCYAYNDQQLKFKWPIKTLLFSVYTLITVNPEIFLNKNLEIVPFSERTHFVNVSTDLEKELGPDILESNLQGQKILPPDHPDSIRVQGIAKNIIEALLGGMELEKGRIEADVSREEVLVKGTKYGSRHLQGMRWEVMVVDSPRSNAFCAPNGKIVILAELLKRLGSDDEIAFIIGHEVAHVAARHVGEVLSKLDWLFLPVERLLGYFLPSSVIKDLELLLAFPLRLRLEIEADYIGLLLMAAAGYDPQLVRGILKKAARGAGIGLEISFREKLLSRAKIMQKAMDIYRETIGRNSMQPSTTVTKHESHELYGYDLFDFR